MNVPQDFDAYIPVYDSIPAEWENARQYIVEQLKQISNAVNIREVGWYLDQELLSGKQFIPGANLTGASTQYRSIFRKVVDCGPIVAGVNPPIPHGVTFDNRLTSIDSWVEATNSTTFQAVTLVSPELTINGGDIIINSPGNFDRCFFFWEYIQEL